MEKGRRNSDCACHCEICGCNRASDGDGLAEGAAILDADGHVDVKCLAKTFCDIVRMSCGRIGGEPKSSYGRREP